MDNNLFGKNLSQITDICKRVKLGKGTAKELFKYIYRKGESDFYKMELLSDKARNILSDNFEISTTTFVDVQTSVDGTKKYLFKYDDNKFVEAAYIPEADRATLCISCQMGCKMGCSFCFTAKQGFQCDLTVAQIINQLHSIPERNKVTNIVFMGMGEPFDNMENVFSAIDILSDHNGYSLAETRITVSTIGIIPGMKRLLEDTACKLAISLHNPIAEQRREIMPVEKVHSIENIKSYLQTLEKKDQQRVFFEYIVFSELNHSEQHADELGNLLSDLACKVNLIKYNTAPDSEFVSPTDSIIEEFQKKLINKGIVTTYRRSRGADIFAACGLLSTKSKVK